MSEIVKSLPENEFRVLVADDEKAIRRFLRVSLQTHGYQVFEAASAQEAQEGFVSFHPDVLILDLGLPDKDGLEVIRELRKTTQMPIVILSVRENETDKILALDAGADDYLTKPFHIGELLARMRAVLRRFDPDENHSLFQSDGLSVDFDGRIVQVNGESVHLTPIEFNIFRLFILNAGKVVTHRQIFQAIWNKDSNYEGVDHLLRVTIRNLRNKIEPNPQRPTFILTEPGIGYRLRTNF